MDLTYTQLFIWIFIMLIGYAVMFGVRGKIIKRMILVLLIISFIAGSL